MDVGSERAGFDETVGVAKTGDATIRVDQGLAHVREFESGRVQLWAQAPNFSFTLNTGDTGSWEIELRNAMANAELTTDVVSTGSPAMGTMEDGTPVVTEKVWRVEVAPREEMTFYVRSEIDETEPWNFVVFADVQDHIDDVQDIYDTMKLDPSIQFGLISGDLTEQGAASELARFQEEMRTLPFPCFATLGNHELGNGETTFHNFFGRGNFSFGHGGARFTLLDSASATIAEPVWSWIDDWIVAAGDNPHLVVMHIPPLDVSGVRSGGFASRQEANRLLGVFARGGVDMTIYGHVHTYSAFRNAGIPAYISGGGGAIPMRLDGIGRHYLSITVDRQRGFTPTLVRVYPEN